VPLWDSFVARSAGFAAPSTLLHSELRHAGIKVKMRLTPAGNLLFAGKSHFMSGSTDFLIASRARRLLAFALALLSATPVPAAQIILKDGRVLEAEIAKISGVAVNPVASGGHEAEQVKYIVMCDDHLRRTMVAEREVRNVVPSPPPRVEHFFIKGQQVAEAGTPVASIGAIVQETKWDKFGRHTMTIQIGRSQQSVIQGLTEITPMWSKAETLTGGARYLWDMRIATSSIPRDELKDILAHQIDNPKDPDQRLKLVRFYLQAERFTEAEAELKQVIADFKDLPNQRGLNQTLQDLRSLSARQALDEIAARNRAGQYKLAGRLLQAFPTQDTPGAVLREVRDRIEQGQKTEERRLRVIAKLDEQLGRIKDDAVKNRVKTMCDEIKKEMSVATLDRMAPFLQFAADGDMTAEQKLALAISGWLLGGNDAIDNLQTALSLAETRTIIRAYLTEEQARNRSKLVSSLRSQQGASPKYVAELIAHMSPPLATPQQKTPGFFRLETPGLEGEDKVTYFVQLPPEYDPHFRYPAIVTLHAAGRTPEQQIDWWAGVSEAALTRVVAAAEAHAPEDGVIIGAAAGKTDDASQLRIAPAAFPTIQPPARGGLIDPDMRRGQAARQGYIVIAPAWAKRGQTTYEYSAREHAAVLKSLINAMKRFSIDTDRVFLSGHSMGGDAGWDIGLAHPDLWAGVIPIVATSGKYVPQYWPNAERVPFYFVAGELDGNKTVTNGPQLDRYFSQPAVDHELWDVTYVEYQGRGHEHFADEILRIFDWMGRKRRNFFPKQFKAVTMRPWDKYFWCVGLDNMPPAQMVDPDSWPPPRSTLPFALEFKANGNIINVSVRNARVTLWLSPEMVDFNRSVEVTIGGSRVTSPRGIVKPSVEVILEDVRLRGDRQHPFWAKVEH
jgi:predicted esterase